MHLDLQPDPHLLLKALDRFPGARVLVVGDIILDRYIWGDVQRISPEAPVPVVDVKRESRLLGGAANVVHNLCTLGAQPRLCGVIGHDFMGREVLRLLEGIGAVREGVALEEGRITSIKTRVVAHQQQIVRYDREQRRPIEDATVQRFLGFVRRHLDSLDAILVSDYGKGVVSAPLMKALRALVHDHPIRIAVDPKTGNFEYYHGVDVITPNHHEAGAFCGFEIDDEASLLRAGRRMLDALACRSVLITQGKDGMTLFEHNGDITHIPTVARQVYDVTGAGDTVVSTFALGMACGLDLKTAAHLSNLAAGIVVGEFGTTTIRATELRKSIEAARDRC